MDFSFFFQAEDGIRDLTVTGVQTCALPISLEAQQRPRAVKITEFLEKYAPDPHAALHRVALRTGIPLGTLRKPEQLERSEERRVGKECRAGESTDHEEKTERQEDGRDKEDT